MVTLKDVQDEIKRQAQRDYSQRSIQVLQDLFCLGLAEEAGEVAGLMKRRLRSNLSRGDQERSSQEHFKEELGDVLWYLTACCEVFGTSLDEIWEYNTCKLQKRYGGK